MATSKAGTANAASWAKRVERLQRSGLSIRAFAAREGLKAGSLSFWKWKLAQQGQVPGRARAKRVRPVQFVELRTKGGQGPAVLDPVGARFEVILTSGRTVRVASGFDGAELVRLVGVLEEAWS